MIQPQSLDLIPVGWLEQKTVWAIRGRSGKYLAIPDHRFPGRKPIRFFTSEVGAERAMRTVLELKPILEKQELEVVGVFLSDAIRRIKGDKVPPLADSYVINTPDEVFELVTFLRNKPAK